MIGTFRRLASLVTDARVSARREPRTARPRLEALEDRALPAMTFTVTNLNDAGAGSLRQAILDANGAAGADVIQFQSGLSGTINLTSGSLQIDDDVNIQGPGANAITLKGNNATRVFFINPGAATDIVSISGVTITGGRTIPVSGLNPGAGLLIASGIFNLTDAVVTGNNADGGGGGGVYL